MSKAEEDFNNKYISSIEIASRMGVTRAAIMQARSDGRLPGSFSVCGGVVFLWERELVEPHIVKWDEIRKARRGY